MDTSGEMALTADLARLDDKGLGETGIYVRAQDSAGKWGNYDIVHLTRGSLKAWLRSRGGENEWAENVVMILLGH